MAAYTLRQVECFVAVAEHGSIAAAAEALRVSQSAVSGAVTDFERILGTQLALRRKAHGVTLTPSGRYVLDQARGLLHAAGDLQLHAADAGAELHGALMLGCYQTLAPTVLAELIAHYAERHPGVELDFFAGTQSDVNEGLLSGRLDLAVAYDLALPTGLERQALYSEVPSLLLAPDHPLAGREGIALAELADEPMILLDVDPSRENTLSMFADAGLGPRIRFRTTDFETTRSLVARGLGYSLLVQRPAADISYEGRPLVVRPIRPAVRHVRVSLVWPAGVRLSRAADAMRRVARERYPQPEFNQR
jgi:DNA-binding transcriptional LysR family regulator